MKNLRFSFPLYRKFVKGKYSFDFPDDIVDVERRNPLSILFLSTRTVFLRLSPVHPLSLEVRDN